MPTVLRKGPYRFFFYSGDKLEPPHVHVERDSKVTKFWLQPVKLHSSYGFGPIEIRRIQTIIKNHDQLLLEAWNGYFTK